MFKLKFLICLVVVSVIYWVLDANWALDTSIGKGDSKIDQVVSNPSSKLHKRVSIYYFASWLDFSTNDASKYTELNRRMRLGMSGEEADYVWEKIIKTHAKGSLRDKLIYSYFLGADISIKDAFKRMDSLVGDSETTMANMGFIFRVSGTTDARYLNELNELNAKNLSSERISCLVGSLAYRVDPFTNVYSQCKDFPGGTSQNSRPNRSEREAAFNDSYAVLVKLLDKLSDVEKSKQLKYFLDEVSYSAPSAAWETLIKLPKEQFDFIDEVERKSLFDKIAKSWLFENQEEAIENSIDSGKGLSGLSLAMIQKDESEGIAWFKENMSSFSRRDRDHVIESISKKMTLSKNYDEARKWVTEITDPATKDRSIKGMAQFRSGEIREQTKKSPKTTANSLLEESHIESPLLMGVAVNEWLNNKPDDAGKWFFENSKSMNDAQRDSSAEAFVQYGIKVGDLEAARQWADEHSSEEQRLKYYKQIDHAEVEQVYKKN